MHTGGRRHGRRKGVVMSNDEVIEKWLEWLAAADGAEQSLKVRRAQANQIAKAHDLQTVTEDDLIKLLSSQRLAKSTKRAYRSGWRSLFGWMMVKGYRPDNPAARLPSVRVPQAVPRPTTEEAVAVGLTVDSERDALMVALGAYEGMRRNEIATLRIDNITPFGLRVTGKGERTRVLPIHPKVDALLRAWVAKQPGPWVFPSPRDVTRHISADYVGRHLKAATGEVGHALRHRFATVVYNSSGHDLRTTQELLGHSSPQTTAIYTLVGQDAKTAAVLSIA